MNFIDKHFITRFDRQCDKGVLIDISTYDRAGNVLTYTHRLTKSDGTVLTLSGTNTFDGAGRVKKWSSQGCLLLTRKYFNSFNEIMKGVQKFTVQVIRSVVKLSNNFENANGVVVLMMKKNN